MKETATIRMLGNHGDYEFGEIYTIPVEEANQLSGLGFAAIIPDLAPEAEED